MSATVEYRFPPSFGGIELAVVSFSTDLSRDVLEHRPHRGDGAQLSDRGRTPRRDTLSITLVGNAEEVAAARATLFALAASGESRPFVHPLDGQWSAKLGAFNEVLGRTSEFTILLIEDVLFSERNERTETARTIQDVETAGEEYDALLELLAADGIVLPEDSPTGAEATDLAREWSAVGSLRQQQTELEAYREQTRAPIALLRESESTDAWAAATAQLRLLGTMEQYSAGLQAQTLQHNSVTVPRTQPLAILLTGVYGAAEGQRQFDDVVRTNRITDPLRVQQGTILTLPRP